MALGRRETVNVYFNENMTYREARNKLYTIVNGKSKSEIEAIKKEYAAIAPVLIEREMKNSDPWTLTSDPLE